MMDNLIFMNAGIWFDVDCNGRNNNDTHRGKKPSSIVSSSNSSVFVDAATGVITYGENYEPNRDVSYSVTMSCTGCDVDDWDGDGTDDWYGGTFTSETELTLIGFLMVMRIYVQL